MTDTSIFEVNETAGADLSSLLTMANELIQLERSIADAETMLKQMSGRANELKLRVIPDAMAELGLNEVVTSTGDRLKVDDFINGSLPKDPLKRMDAIAAIEEMGGSGIIKNEVNLSFEKSQHNEAVSIADELRQKGFHVDLHSGIHPQTYHAFIRERLRNGEHVDVDRLGVFVGRRTKVEMAK